MPILMKSTANGSSSKNAASVLSSPTTSLVAAPAACEAELLVVDLEEVEELSVVLVVPHKLPDCSHT